MEHCRTTVAEYCEQSSEKVNQVCSYVGIARSSYYYQRGITQYVPTGRKPPGFTINRDGKIIPDVVIIEIIKEYRKATYFMNAGGSKKLSKYIAVEKNIYVNHKKIY